MKYDTIEIRPTSFDDKRWRVLYDNSDKIDRVSRKKYEPHSLGFFIFPRKWGPVKGFKTLKNHMIELRKAEIAKLQQSIQELEELELPDYLKK